MVLSANADFLKMNLQGMLTTSFQHGRTSADHIYGNLINLNARIAQFFKNAKADAGSEPGNIRGYLRLTL